MKKKLFSLFLAICMMISLLPVTAVVASATTSAEYDAIQPGDGEFMVEIIITYNNDYDNRNQLGSVHVGYSDILNYSIVDVKKEAIYDDVPKCRKIKYIFDEPETWTQFDRAIFELCPSAGCKIKGLAQGPNLYGDVYNLPAPQFPSQYATRMDISELASNRDGSYNAQVAIRSLGGNYKTERLFVSFERADPSEIPAVPTNLAWDGTTAKWDAVAEATDYKVYLYEKIGTNGHLFTTLDYTYTNSYDFTAAFTGYLPTDKNYVFVVEAIKNKVCSGESVISAEKAGLHTHTPADWQYDGEYHWKECDDCGRYYDVATHSPTNGTCTICQYTPATPPVTPPSRPSREPDPEPTYLPYIADDEMTWDEVCKYLKTLNNGDEVDIHLGGANEVPEKVMKVIADKELKVNFIYSYAKSWFVDGAKIDSPAETNLAISAKTSPDTSELRGIVGTSFEVFGANFPVEQTISFKTEHAGKFANLYKIEDDKPVFVATVRIDEDGKAKFADMSAEGEYVIMIGEYSDLSGDMDNNGIVNVNDALAVLKRSLGILNGKNPYVADVNNDGAISITDALLILKASIAG